MDPSGLKVRGTNNFIQTPIEWGIVGKLSQRADLTCVKQLDPGPIVLTQEMT
jgi:hypothetical protein